MAHEEAQIQAQEMFEEQRMQPKDIAAQLGLPKGTVHRWIKEKGWKKSVVNNALNKIERLSNLRELVNKLFDEIAATNNPDEERLRTLRGYMDLLDKYEKNVDIRGTILMATKEIIKCMREERQDLIEAFIPFLQNDFPKWIKKQYPEQK